MIRSREKGDPKPAQKKPRFPLSPPLPASDCVDIRNGDEGFLPVTLPVLPSLMDSIARFRFAVVDALDYRHVMALRAACWRKKDTQ